MRDQMKGVYHVNTNLVVDIDGHTATAVSYLLTLRAGPPSEIMGFSRYEDDLVKTGAGGKKVLLARHKIGDLGVNRP